MSIRIDGDACPSLQKVIDLAHQYSISIHIYCDVSHVIKSDTAIVHTVDCSYQMVDVVLYNHAEPKDFVITQDVGLAQLLLSKKCIVCNTKGHLYSDNIIDYIILQRHIFLRKNKFKYRKGPKKRTKKDEENLLKTIENWIINANQ